MSRITKAVVFLCNRFWDRYLFPIKTAHVPHAVPHSLHVCIHLHIARDSVRWQLTFLYLYELITAEKKIKCNKTLSTMALYVNGPTQKTNYTKSTLALALCYSSSSTSAFFVLKEWCAPRRHHATLVRKLADQLTVIWQNLAAHWVRDACWSAW